MPAQVDIIDTVTTPPLASLQQVLDTGGPYAAGSHTRTTFATNGAFLLPAGTYDVSGTYGVIVQLSGLVPSSAGFQVGWNDVTEPIISGDVYEDRIAQVLLIHTLPITGAHVIVQTFDIHLVSQMVLWPVYIGTPARIGLYVFPNFHVDLFYMCVL